MNSGVIIATQDFLSMSERTQTEIMDVITGKKGQKSPSEYSGGAADLSSLQATQLVRGLSGKSRSVLKGILELSETESGCWLKELEELLGVEPDSLAGVWSGLTRRTRTITNDDNAYLIDWTKSEERGDYFGSFNTITEKNLRNALNIR